MTGKPLSPPISTAAVHSFGSYASLAEYHNHRFAGQRYGRDSSDIVLDVEHSLEAMYGGRYRGLLFGSGMTAITAVLDTLMDEARTLYVPNEYYRKLRDLTNARWSPVEYRDVTEIKPDGPALVWIESPSNPHVRIADYAYIEALRRGCDDLRIVADLTLAGLANFNGPFWLFDAEVHSCTKYAGGHNDLMAGLAMVNPRHYTALWDRRSFAGGILDPWGAWLLARSLKTYDVRMERHLSNTDAVLGYLRDHLPAERIFYPSTSALRDYHDHGGAMVSFCVNEADPIALTDRAAELDTIQMAPNFGSVDTLIEVPATMSHYGKTVEQLVAAGIEPNLVRLSVGIEPIDLILKDLCKLLCVAA